MKFVNRDATLFVPDGTQDGEIRTTHMWIGAHQDDAECAAFGPILECYEDADLWFTVVTVADGSGSPRGGRFANFTDEEMKIERRNEQNTAAAIGKYAAMYQLAYPSSEVKMRNNKELVSELANIILRCRPEYIFTHNLADKHETHVAVVLRVISALKLIQDTFKPKSVISLEGWRGLDWINDDEKVIIPTSGAEDLELALLQVFQSQIDGGRSYDIAAISRRTSNAVFFESHDVAKYLAMNFGMDITDLVYSDLDPFIWLNNRFIQPFADSIKKNIETHM